MDERILYKPKRQVFRLFRLTKPTRRCSTKNIQGKKLLVAMARQTNATS
jgi:hypothetical protein